MIIVIMVILAFILLMIMTMFVLSIIGIIMVIIATSCIHEFIYCTLNYYDYNYNDYIIVCIVVQSLLLLLANCYNYH